MIYFSLCKGEITVDLPMKAFCLKGNNGKIELTIDEVFGFPGNACIEGGYGFLGHLDLHVGSYEVHCAEFYSSTGRLHRLLAGLQTIYQTLEGTARYKHLYENDFQFVVEMTHFGHAAITGSFHECPHLSNELTFEMETDQTCIERAMNDLKAVERAFGDAIAE